MTNGFSNNPWDYLGTAVDIPADGTAVSFISSGYKLLKLIGIIGCAVTMIIAIIRFTSSNASVRADAKNLFSKKVVLLFFIFTAAYCFGYVWGLFASI